MFPCLRDVTELEDRGEQATQFLRQHKGSLEKHPIGYTVRLRGAIVEPGHFLKCYSLLKRVI